jgi:hypothetical protein
MVSFNCGTPPGLATRSFSPVNVSSLGWLPGAQHVNGNHGCCATATLNSDHPIIPWAHPSSMAPCAVRRGATPREMLSVRDCCWLPYLFRRWVVEGVARVRRPNRTPGGFLILRRLKNALCTAQALAEPAKQNNRVKLPQFDL